jgi:hypothetical protein
MARISQFARSGCETRFRFGLKAIVTLPACRTIAFTPAPWSVPASALATIESPARRLADERWFTRVSAVMTGATQVPVGARATAISAAVWRTGAPGKSPTS